MKHYACSDCPNDKFIGYNCEGKRVCGHCPPRDPFSWWMDYYVRVFIQYRFPKL